MLPQLGLKLIDPLLQAFIVLQDQSSNRERITTIRG